MRFHHVNTQHTPSSSLRRQRIEWPTLDPKLCHQLQRPSPTHVPALVMVQANAVIIAEIGRCNLWQPFENDCGVFAAYLRPEPDVGSLLKTLYVRGRAQSAVWDVFELLRERGLVRGGSLQYPLSIGRSSGPVSAFSGALACFTGPQDLDRIGKPEDKLWEAEFPEAVSWLAAMILRDFSDLNAIMNTINASGILGAHDAAAFQVYLNLFPQQQFIPNPDEMTTQPGGASPFGFWLPHGLLVQSAEEAAIKISSHIERFNRIEAAYMAYFNLLDEDLLLDVPLGGGVILQTQRKL